MAHGVAALTHRVERLEANMDSLTCLLHEIKEILQTMPTREEFDAAQAGLMQAVADAAARVSTDIQALRDQLAAGNPITDADLSAIQARTQEVANIDPATVPAGGRK